MELLDFENHVKLIIAVFVVMWLFECGNLTIQHIFKNCYFFEDLGENIFRTCCHVSGLVQFLQKSSVNVYAGICKWLKRGAFLQKSIVLKIGKLLFQHQIYNRRPAH